MAVPYQRHKWLTPYQRHKKKWGECQKCPLHRTRNKVVLARGKIPADVLFIGEAPGASEDVLGKPFIGPAGKLLDRIIRESLGNTSYLLTNLVGCIPLGDDGNKTAEPPPKRIKSCSPRLQELVKMCDPEIVVYVGKLAQRYGPRHLDKTKTVSIIHPAAILRMDVSQKGLAMQRNIVTLKNAVEVPF